MVGIFKLKQFGRTVTEYETKLRELSEFVLELVNSEEYLYFKFEEGLFLEIKEKISIIETQSYKKGCFPQTRVFRIGI